MVGSVPVATAKAGGDFARDGYAVIPGVLSGSEVEHVVSAIGDKPVSKAGTRALLDMAWCALLAERLSEEPGIRALLPANAQPVQCTLFAKTAETNWLVSLHQDLSVPVAERVNTTGWVGWSQKEGQTFVQPPLSVLEEVLAIRIHLDDCTELNGALRVVPGSHRLGRLSSDDARRERETRGECVVPVPKGGAMLMRPLLLHASSKSQNSLPRHVLHFVYGPTTLPQGLRWPARKKSLAENN